jgi:hypothetical protein
VVQLYVAMVLGLSIGGNFWFVKCNIGEVLFYSGQIPLAAEREDF